MTQPTTFSFGKGILFLGDGATPGTFTAPCGFKRASVSLEKDSSDTVVPNCDDPDAPAWIATDVTSIRWRAGFSGVLAKDALPLYEAAFLSGASRPIRFDIVGGGTGAGTPTRRYSGKAHLTLKITAERGQRMEVEIDLVGDGPLTIASVAA